MQKPHSRPTSSSTVHPHWNDRGDYGLNPTEEIFEVDEETHSVLLGPDGQPLRYKSKKLGHIGFTKLSER
jgi:hypothetical protein